MPPLLSVDEALRRVLDAARPLPLEEVPLAESVGRVLAADAQAVVDLPPFASSAMDGYAVRAADTPGVLRVVGSAAAGRPAERRLGPGEAIGISTGAVVPEGADSVVPIEHVVVLEDNNAVRAEAVVEGANIRPRGGDVGAGEVVAPQGSRVRGPVVGALAAAGIASVRCARRPRVVVLSTGSELRAPGSALEPGQIYESNSLLLSAQVADAGGVAAVRGPVRDEEEALRESLGDGLLVADVLVTSGGVSVGPHDLVRRLLGDLGVEERFWGVAVRPGKPVFFATHGETLVFGLPGNPVSSLVGFELFVRPALAALQGDREPGPAYVSGRLAAPVRRNSGRDELVRARSRAVNGGIVLEPLSGQESHMIVRAAAADALVLVPRGSGELAAGSEVSYLRI